MDITTNIEGSKAWLAISGKMTVQTSPEFTAEIDALPPEVSDLEIDLADVTYIASAGLRVLVGANKMAAKRGGTMVLLNPREEVWEVFEMTGLADVFVIER